MFKNISVINSKTPSIQDAAKTFTYFIPVTNSEDVSGVVSKLLAQEKIIIQSFSKKDEVFLDKDIRPMILDINHGKLNLQEKILEIIDEVSPCRIPGIFVTASVKQGTSIRPSEIVDVLKAQGLKVERPIKIGIELNV